MTAPSPALTDLDKLQSDAEAMERDYRDKQAAVEKERARLITIQIPFDILAQKRTDKLVFLRRVEFRIATFAMWSEALRERVEKTLIGEEAPGSETHTGSFEYVLRDYHSQAHCHQFAQIAEAMAARLRGEIADLETQMRSYAAKHKLTAKLPAELR